MGSGEDDATQGEDWAQLGASTTGMNFHAYMCVNEEFATCGVVGSGSCREEG
jgi:hypothetical protein